jgi:hypothetical protein
MITAYKAPISPEDAQAIVDYLVRTKGGFIGSGNQAHRMISSQFSKIGQKKPIDPYLANSPRGLFLFE